MRTDDIQPTPPSGVVSPDSTNVPNDKRVEDLAKTSFLRKDHLAPSLVGRTSTITGANRVAQVASRVWP